MRGTVTIHGRDGRIRPTRARALASAVAALTVLLLLAGCGGGSTTTVTVTRRAHSDGGPGPGPGVPAAGVTARLRRTRRGLAERHAVREGELVRGEQGWVRSFVGMFWTTDGGRSWRPITPPVPDAGQLVGAYFASPRRGWALAEPGREGETRPSMYTTTDGGRSWHRSRLRAYQEIMPAVRVSFSLVGKDELFAQIKFSGDTASDYGPLLVSHDGGIHWRALPDPPHAGRISFESARRGWLAGRSPSTDLWRTADGGRTWTQVEPGSPTGAPLPVPGPPREEFESLETGAVLGYLPPLIDRSGHGLLPEVRSSRAEPGSEAIVWTTADDGRHWRRGARVPIPHFGGTVEAAEVFARPGRSLSLLVHDPNTGAVTVIGPDGRAGPTRTSRGSPPWSMVTLSDLRHGFAYSGFIPRTSLVFTEDGGRNWTKARIPRAPRWPESLAPAAIAGPRIIHRAPAAHGRLRGRPGTQAAGVCPAAKGPRVIAYLSSGSPIVPCWLVSPRQHLVVANVTGNDGPGDPPRVETVDLAGFHARLAPGQAVLLDEPIGAYLGPGNHLVGGVTAVDIRIDRKARCEAPNPPPCPSG